MQKQKNDDEGWDVAGRISSLNMFTGSLVAPRRGEATVIPIGTATTARVPQPRRSRIFLRGGGGHGAFAELTLTAPQPRRAPD